MSHEKFRSTGMAVRIFQTLGLTTLLFAAVVSVDATLFRPEPGTSPAESPIFGRQLESSLHQFDVPSPAPHSDPLAVPAGEQIAWPFFSGTLSGCATSGCFASGCTASACKKGRCWRLPKKDERADENEPADGEDTSEDDGEPPEPADDSAGEEPAPPGDQLACRLLRESEVWLAGSNASPVDGGARVTWIADGGRTGSYRLWRSADGTPTPPELVARGEIRAGEVTGVFDERPPRAADYVLELTDASGRSNLYRIALAGSGS